MLVVRKSLLRKLFLHFILFGGLVGALAFSFYSLDYRSISLEIFLISLSVFVLYFLLVYFFYIVKPLRTILTQMRLLLTGRKYKKIYTQRVDELGVIAHFFNEVTKNLGSLAGTIQEQKRLSSELQMAADLQDNVLPKETPAIPGLAIAVKSRPAEEVGGDSFDFISLEGKTYMYVGDVTGHGIPAALVMTMAHALLRVFAEEKTNAYETVVEANTHLKKHIQPNMFMTMLFLSWDHTKGQMSYVGCGHEYLLVFRAKTGKCERINAGGMALGMVPDNSKLVKEKTVDLDEGDIALVFTDGVVEARNNEGKMYEIDRLQEKFTEYSTQYSPNDIHKHIALDFSQFVGSHEQEDDITLMVIKRVSNNESVAEIEKDDSSESDAEQK